MVIIVRYDYMKITIIRLTKLPLPVGYGNNMHDFEYYGKLGYITDMIKSLVNGGYPGDGIFPPTEVWAIMCYL